MASYRKRRRRKKKALAWIIVLAIILVAAAAVFGIIYYNKKAPSKTVTDLEYYYNLKINAMEGRDAAASDELAIVLENEILTERAFESDGEVYISHSLVKDSIDERFYYDSNEELLIVTNAEQVITAGLDQSYIDIDGTQESKDYVVFTEKKGEIYIAADFVSEYSSAGYEVFEDPARIVITYKTGEKTFVDVTKKTSQIRVLGGIKSEIVGSVEEGDKLQVIDDLDDWLRVVSEEGWIGYIPVSAVSEQYTETITSDYNEPEYTSLKMDEPVKLAWASTYSTGANDSYSTYTANSDGIINVYCPTWYFLADTEGTVTMTSDSYYVDKAHEDGYAVWALFADEDYEYAEQVLTHTSVRQSVEDQVINNMLEIGVDGLNVDFERIDSGYGDDFIQFIRELSIKCRANGLYLSVDNYTPYDYNACFHIEEQSRLCDYVILMAYDDYVGSGEAGPNSSLPFIREALELSISKVDESKLICALPFYSRVWTTESDGTLSRTEYTMSNGWSLLNQVGVSADWDDELGVYYAEYTSGSKTIQAWLEDEDTIRAKLELTKEFDLAGVAFWQYGQELSAVWDVIAEY